MKVVNFVLGWGYILLKYFVIAKLYTWFILPMTNFPLTMWQIWGISLVYQLLKSDSRIIKNALEDKDDDDMKLKINLSMIFLALLTWLLGYILAM